jgi:hypothetical protein
MSAPVRIKRSRAKGWTMPENTVYVGRPTKWGNPYVGDGPHDNAMVTKLFREYCARPEQAEFVRDVRAELRGKNLACWCALDLHCHADVLLDIANTECVL